MYGINSNGTISIVSPVGWGSGEGGVTVGDLDLVSEWEAEGR